MTRFGTFALVSALILLGAPPSAQAGPLERGYVGRACGFDMDRDGISGEAADCNVCDGVTVDPDGDGTNEDLIYVDCGSGSNSGSCGSPSNPCASIGYAISNRADGTGDGAEDIICFTGTCRTEANVRLHSGLNTSYTRPAEGNEVRSFQYPSNPAMLVGWDTDNDGRYPPFDTDDHSLLDGGAGGLTRAFKAADGGTDYFEMAHFEATGYGTTTAAAESIGFATLSEGATRFFAHDLALSEINKDKALCSNAQIFNSLAGGSPYKYVTVENIDCNQCGGYFLRGGQGKGPDIQGPIRIKNVTFTIHPCNDGSCATSGGCSSVSEAAKPAATMVKLWGMVTGIEILDSVMHGNLGAWTPHSRSSVGGIVPDVCSQDWDIINNAFIDVRSPLVVQPSDGGFCEGASPSVRRITDLNFTRNYIRYTSAADKYAETSRIPIKIDTGRSGSHETVESVTISNNFVSAVNGYKTCFWSEAGYESGCSSHGGQIRFVNNTCAGNISSSSYGAIVIGTPEGSDPEPACAADNYVIKNNLITGPNGQRNIRVTYTVDSLDLNNNVYSPTGTYTWKGTNLTADLATWQSRSGGDSNSEECNPSLVDRASGDLHLTSSDTCARDSGTNLSSVVNIDIDDGSRPGSSGWDIGADEFGSEGEGGGGIPIDQPDPDPDPNPNPDPDPDPDPDPGPGPAPAPPSLQEAQPLAG